MTTMTRENIKTLEDLYEFWQTGTGDKAVCFTLGTKGRQVYTGVSFHWNRDTLCAFYHHPRKGVVDRWVAPTTPIVLLSNGEV